jgi:GNAT superfamily N-acetyltransferase
VTVTLRDATTDDAGLIAGFVRALAEFEKLADHAVASDADFVAAIAGDKVSALIAEKDGTAVGFALWFQTFSTFTGQPGFYLEDIYVEPEYRGHGIGRAILRNLAGRALAMGCARMEWAVLDWNKPAVDFYRAIGAKPMAEWTVQRMDRGGLAALAE